MYYRGKGEHSVKELEQIIFELQEKEHFMNAPYLESCLHRLENLRSDTQYIGRAEDFDFIKMFLTGIKNNSKPQNLFTNDQLAMIKSKIEYCDEPELSKATESISAYLKQKQG